MKKLIFASLFFSLPMVAQAATAPVPAIRNVVLDISKQSVSVDFAADVGFPYGVRYAVATLNCATGELSSAAGDSLDDFSDEKEGVAALMASGAIKASKTELSIIGTGMDDEKLKSIRFFCKDKILYWDFNASIAGKNPVGFVGTTVAYGLNSVSVPGYSWSNSSGTDSLMYDLTFNNEIAKATTITQIKPQLDLASKAALFMLDKDGKTLIPLAYGENVNDLKAPLAFKRGTGGTVLNLYLAEDYQKTDGWYHTLVDFVNGTSHTEAIKKPANFVFGK